jgi:hypothetical protein
LNDVSMALWAKARSLHELGEVERRLSCRVAETATAAKADAIPVGRLQRTESAAATRRLH